MAPTTLRAALGALRRRFAPARLRRASPFWLMLACLLLLSGCALVPWAQAAGGLLIALAALVLSACGGGSSGGGGWPSEITVGSLTASEGFIVEGGSSDLFAFSIAAGDINGDGIDDIAISATYTYTTQYYGGRVYVLFGSTGIADAIGVTSQNISAVLPAHGMSWSGVNYYGYDGRSVAIAKDIDGDNIGDLIIGSPKFDYTSQNGRAWVIFGDNTWNAGDSRTLEIGGTGILADGSQGFLAQIDQSAYTYAPPYADIRVGKAVVSLDVNGDGFSEVAVSAPYGRRWNPTPCVYAFANPRATVLFGKNSLSLSSPFDVGSGLAAPDGAHIGEPYTSGFSGYGGYELEGSTWGTAGSYTNTFFGGSMAAGDMNNDGYDDLIIGAQRQVVSEGYTGGALVVFGKTGATPSFTQNVYDTSHLHIYGITSGYYTRVDYLGDVNGDNVGDLIITAPNYNAAYVVFGVSGDNSGRNVNLRTLDGNDGFKIDLGNDAPGNNFQSPRTAAGHDVNGDGKNDILLGVGGQGEYGATDVTAHVIFGKTNLGAGGLLDLSDGTLGSTAGFTIKRAAPTIHPISSVAFGDINGDGKEDLIIGTYRDAESTTTVSGRVIVVFGK